MTKSFDIKFDKIDLEVIAKWEKYYSHFSGKEEGTWSVIKVLYNGHLIPLEILHDDTLSKLDEKINAI